VPTLSIGKLPTRLIHPKRPRATLADDHDVPEVPADACLVRRMTLYSVLARGTSCGEFEALSRKWAPSDSAGALWHTTSRHYVPKSCG
jgi:hypothetical protein